MSILEAAKQERKRLISMLQADQNYCRLQAIEQLIATYNNKSTPSEDATETPAPKTMGGAQSKQSRAIAAAVEYISAHGGQAELFGIHEYVRNKVDLDKRRLSILLSTSDKLHYNRATKLWEYKQPDLLGLGGRLNESPTP